MTIIFATHNAHKVNEVQALLDADIQLKSLSEIGWHTEVPETSPTIEGNAIQKAQHLYKHLQKSVMAEDTGLEVDALHDEPGVHTARYAGPQRSADDNMDLLLQKLSGQEDRSAQFRTVVAYIDHSGQVHTFTGICRGRIAPARSGDGGFGYDPIFIPQGHRRTFAEMDAAEKNALSHRGKAIRQWVDFLLS